MHAEAAAPLVFIVESDASVREALESLIRAEGWRSLAFASAGEFLNHPRVAGPSCLLLEVHLPDLHGLELQQRVADRSHFDNPSSEPAASQLNGHDPCQRPVPAIDVHVGWLACLFGLWTKIIKSQGRRVVGS